MNWQGLSGPECPKDKYYDPNTGNCDKCAPLCAVSNCAQVCPDFKLPDVPSDPDAVSSSGGSGAIIYWPVVTVFLIIVAIFALSAFLVCKTYYKKMKEWFIRKRTKLSIQESKNDNEPQMVVLHGGTEIGQFL
ncbi:hypothetical protein CHS0354_020338 [Potamilus streckersoni]|uniref:Uncharacterized protein n=1 Tax=Potamilus streckersoni TaxID=2493646 RepID=A0AAE0VUZ4_9BIVA|nr:hypothetical protein CHS0354_020338 [Potamilus streckersoni]